jgi:hypothetical protein
VSIDKPASSRSSRTANGRAPSLLYLPLIAILLLGGWILAACSGIGGTVGGGSLPAETGFLVVGISHTPFTATITDTVASWTLTGVAPLSVVILNNNPPVRMFATKLSGDTLPLSIEIISGSTILGLASTSDPFGTAVIQTGQGLVTIAPPADPDTRFFVKGSPGGFFTGLIEDLNKGFSLGNGVPTLFLFERPDGRVVGSFYISDPTFSPLIADLLIGGKIVAHGAGTPSIQLKSP